MPTIGNHMLGAGTTSYGDVIFQSMYSSRLSNRLVYDDADRRVRFNEITFEISATVNSGAGSSTDDDMEEIRQILSAPGLTFVYSEKGYGTNFQVNTGKVWDVAWGPKPELLSCRPVGDFLSADI